MTLIFMVEMLPACPNEVIQNLSLIVGEMVGVISLSNKFDTESKIYDAVLFEFSLK